MTTTNTGSLSNGAWAFVAFAIEKIGDVVKGTLLILGILAANIADVAFGTIAIGVLFGGSNVATVYGFTWLNNWIFGGLISVASSAFQILLWSVIQRRGISFGQVIRWRIPNDIKSLVIVTGIMWLIDTLIDISPISLLIQNSPFQMITWLYWTLVAFVGVLVFFLCGFAEVATSNIREALGVSSYSPATRTSTNTVRTPSQTPQSQPNQRPAPAASSRPLYNEPTYRPTSQPSQSPQQQQQQQRGQRTASGQTYHNPTGENK